MRSRSVRHVLAVSIVAFAAHASNERAPAGTQARTAHARIGSALAPTCPPTWTPAHGGAPGTNNAVASLATFDDGNGIALYAGGAFSSASGVEARGIARWDGASWSALASGISGEVSALATFDDGTGPALYAGGFFHTAGGVPAEHIARWDGASWSPLGSGVASTFPTPDVRALAVFDDGSGPALYAGGRFSSAGGVAASHVARWNGVSWSAVGSGFDAPVASLVVFDDGSGPALYAGGTFTSSGASVLGHVARWNGASWSSVGGGFATQVDELAVFDAGSGAVLCAAVQTSTTTSRVSSWDGATWTALGDFDGLVGALAGFDQGSGPELVAVGRFAHVGALSASNAARWNGASWSPLGAGIAPGIFTYVDELLAIDLGAGPRLVVGGAFAEAGGLRLRNLASWNGASWSAVGSGLDGAVHALAEHDDGSGRKLHAAGEFVSAGGAIMNRVAAWNGASWSPLSSGITGSFGGAASVRALASFDDGGGPMLYAGGTFGLAGGVVADNLARWNGASWSAVPGLSLAGTMVHALAVFDDGGGPALFVGGITGSAPTSPFLMKWDGATWSSLGSGLADGYVRALFVWDDGGGPALYVGGAFSSAGGVAAAGVARWNGATWSALGTGTFGTVASLASFDDGSGSALFAGGNFTSVGGVAAANVARWDGASWSALASGIGGVNDEVNALATFDDGGGTALHAGGRFAAAGGSPARNVARWDGASWSPLGPGVGGNLADSVSALLDFDDGARRLLRVAGWFDASPGGDSHLAAWGCASSEPGVATCAGDGTLATACPCANFGASGRGCASSVNPSGASLTASGRTALDDVALIANGMPATSTAIYLKGDLDNGTGVVFGDGVRCADGVLVRLRARASVAGSSQFPDATDAVTLSARGGTPPSSGLVAHYVAYYRNAAAFCAPATFNATNGYAIVW